MPRPQKCRRVCAFPGSVEFTPAQVRGCEEPCPVVMGVDEYEVIRLIDLEGLTQEQCAARMEIARTTVTGIYDRARHKLADAVVNGKRLVITGGNYRLCDGPDRSCCGGRGCRRAADRRQNKEDMKMKIAVTYEENGQVYQHFGHTQQFKLYTVEDGAVRESQVVGTNGTGHGALAVLLGQLGADVLICGGIGGGAKTALDQAGITLYGGVSGDADAAVQALLEGRLAYDPAAECRHHHDHEHGHDCGRHDHEHGHDCGHHGQCN